MKPVTRLVLAAGLMVAYLMLDTVLSSHSAGVPENLGGVFNSGDAIEQAGVALKSGSVNAPIPAPAASPSFIRVELFLQPFLGTTPQETRRNVESFLSGLGMRLSEYQDNEEHVAAYIYPEKAKSILDSAKSYFIGSKLRALSHVSTAVEMKNKNESFWSVVFLKSMYRPQAEMIFSSLDFAYKLDFPWKPSKPMQNAIWIHLDISGIDDPKSCSRKLKERFPDKVKESGLYRKQVVYEVATH